MWTFTSMNCIQVVYFSLFAPHFWTVVCNNSYQICKIWVLCLGFEFFDPSVFWWGRKKACFSCTKVGSLHLSAEISFRAESFGTVQKFWLRILAQKSFGTEFSCQNSVPKFWAKILETCQNFWHEISARNILAWKTCQNTLPKFSARNAISARRCIDPYCY